MLAIVKGFFFAQEVTPKGKILIHFLSILWHCLWQGQFGVATGGSRRW